MFADIDRLPLVTADWMPECIYSGPLGRDQLAV